MRKTLIAVLLILASVASMSAQGPLTAEESARFEPHWQQLLFHCQFIEREGARVELRCPQTLKQLVGGTGNKIIGPDWDAGVNRVTVDVANGIVLKVQSKRSFIRSLVGNWLTMAASAAAAVLLGMAAR